MEFLPKHKLDELRHTYFKGLRVRLVSMNDFQAPPEGTAGTVEEVEDLGTIHVKWDNGCGLGVIPGEDVIDIIN